MPISRIEDAIEAIARGEMVVVVDDQDRENEGDLIFASEDATAEKIAFMMNKARGLICVSLDHERLAGELAAAVRAVEHVAEDVPKGNALEMSGEGKAVAIVWGRIDPTGVDLDIESQRQTGEHFRQRLRVAGCPASRRPPLRRHSYCLVPGPGQR